MLYEFLKPCDVEKLENRPEFKHGQIGANVTFYEGAAVDLSDYDLAIVGVFENRGSVYKATENNEACLIREQLYNLFIPNTTKPFRLLDLGNIVPGATLKDTYFGLASVMLELLTHKIVPIILGGSHDLTFGQYLGYQELYTLINMVVVDEKINMEEPNREMNADSYLMPILAHNPNYLFNYSHLGYQTYLNDFNAIDMLETLNFDCHRLGMVRDNMEETEPVLRDADMLSIDIAAIRQADAPGHSQASPNGFSGEELCRITRYAGMSDKLTSIGFYEYNAAFDRNNQTSQLIAQMVWYFIEGFYNRKGDFPVNMDEFLKFTVKFEEYDHELIFWKSKATDRWWMELPYGDKQKFARHQMVPCSYADYEMACKEELPDRWMKVYNKLMDA